MQRLTLKHVRLAFRRAHADLERRLLRVLCVEEDEAEDPTQSVQSPDVSSGESTGTTM
jgi:hypothetical protein